MKRNLWQRMCTSGILQAVIGTAVLLSPARVLADPPGSGWTLKFSDDFNGTALDTNKWNTCYLYGCTHIGEIGWYQPDDVIVQNGIVRLRAQKRSVNGYSYTSGLIASHDKYSFQYGYAEIRAKMPKGQSFWPAFWLVPQDRTWPPEINVLEILGREPNRVHMTVHYSESSGHGSTSSSWAGPDFSADYHTFAVEWNPQRIIWYVDGIERQRYDEGANIAGKPMYVIANLGIGNGGWPGAPDSTTPFPSYYDIDYIKVWQRN